MHPAYFVFSGTITELPAVVKGNFKIFRNFFSAGNIGKNAEIRCGHKSPHFPFPTSAKDHFISFLHDRVSSSSVEQGAIWHREAMVWMLAI